ncbi:hypothetical protein EV383_3237 [Pseudonocardia sediminis]|uniref:Uncharacterized protein n=1 Tax=Pseudonocardia sediminis TaxID=1397368 RepID=A0A4Q7UYY4_PSEST|nr:hypothetical protein [Pseudonocardia sediminis]RZT86344.1 hypothetical protein EV383_3237 [Pseudonocardia sediminis]
MGSYAVHVTTELGEIDDETYDQLEDALVDVSGVVGEVGGIWVQLTITADDAGEAGTTGENAVRTAMAALDLPGAVEAAEVMTVEDFEAAGGILRHYEQEPDTAQDQRLDELRARIAAVLEDEGEPSPDA